jgi:hypothetical protein
VFGTPRWMGMTRACGMLIKRRGDCISAVSGDCTTAQLVAFAMSTLGSGGRTTASAQSNLGVWTQSGYFYVCTLALLHTKSVMWCWYRGRMRCMGDSTSRIRAFVDLATHVSHRHSLHDITQHSTHVTRAHTSQVKHKHGGQKMKYLLEAPRC